MRPRRVSHSVRLVHIDKLVGSSRIGPYVSTHVWNSFRIQRTSNLYNVILIVFRFGAQHDEHPSCAKFPKVDGKAIMQANVGQRWNFSPCTQNAVDELLMWGNEYLFLTWFLINEGGRIQIKTYFIFRM